MENADVRETSQLIYQSKGLDETCSKMYVLSNLSNFVKSYRHLSEIFAFLPHTSTHEIWLNHVTPGSNFENLSPSLYSASNFRKRH